MAVHFAWQPTRFNASAALCSSAHRQLQPEHQSYHNHSTKLNRSWSGCRAPISHDQTKNVIPNKWHRRLEGLSPSHLPNLPLNLVSGSLGPVGQNQSRAPELPPQQLPVHRTLSRSLVTTRAGGSGVEETCETPSTLVPSLGNVPETSLIRHDDCPTRHGQL